MVTTVLAMAVPVLGGTAAVKYSGGTGEPNDPYRIAVAQDLSDIANYEEDWNSHFIVTADIDLQGVSLSPIGKYGQSFTGVFNGNDHIIRNAEVNMPSSNYVGLFGNVGSGGQIRDLCVETVTITGENCVGGLAGANEGSITDCCTSGSVTGTEDGDSIGGLVGWNHGSATDCYSACLVYGMEECDNLGGLVGWNDGNITDCYATGPIDVSGSDCDRVGGLVGTNGSNLTGCYSTGSVRGSGRVGGIVGWNLSGSITNCYTTGSVEGHFGVGGLVGANLASIAHCYSTGRVEGFADVGGLVGADSGTVVASFWDVETSYCNVSPGGEGKTTAQMKDINTFLDAGWDFATVWWMPPGDYPRLRSGLYSAGTGTPEDPYQISSLSDWQILMNTSRDWDKHFILVNDINLAEDPRMKLETVGRYYGWNDPNNEPFTGTFDGNEKTIWNFTVNSDSQKNCVGLFGYLGSSGQIGNLRMETIDINDVDSAYIGGLVGFNQGSITDCLVSGGVRGYYIVGGLVGTNDAGTISNCHSRCSILGTGWNIGGLVGANDTGAITGCSYAGAIMGGSNVGGVVGTNDTGTIIACNSTGSVSGGTDGSNIGGIAGYSEGEILRCYSTCAVDGNSLAGGLVGHNCDHGAVITDCYSTGRVSGAYYVGGLVGYNHEGEINNSYSIGNVLGTGWFIGGLIGFHNPDGFVGDSFWDIETSGQPTSSRGTGKKTEEMKTMSTFTASGWDFVEVWGIGENQTYPFLRTEPAGDLSHDKKVDFVDLAIMAMHWLAPNSP